MQYAGTESIDERPKGVPPQVHLPSGKFFQKEREGGVKGNIIHQITRFVPYKEKAVAGVDFVGE